MKNGDICAACAKRLGGWMPPPAIVTCWGGKCDFCGEQKEHLCSTRDYNWPDGDTAVFD